MRPSIALAPAPAATAMSRPNSPEPEEDPILNKYHTIDPGMLHYQRATFERMFHSIVKPLTGEELKTLAEGRRLQLSIENNSVLLLIHHEPWVQTDLWDSMADLLNEWSAHSVAREILPTLLANLDSIQENPIKIPLRVSQISFTS